jgi:hypothetical protein
MGSVFFALVAELEFGFAPFILFVLSVCEGFVVELLFDKCKHGRCVVSGPIEHIRNVAVDFNLLKKAQSQAQRACHKNADVVEHNHYKRAPKHYVLPHPAYSSLH